jgi:hypothetical protein
MANIDEAPRTTKPLAGGTSAIQDGPRSRPLPVLMCGTFVIVLDYRI